MDMICLPLVDKMGKFLVIVTNTQARLVCLTFMKINNSCVDVHYH